MKLQPLRVYHWGIEVSHTGSLVHFEDVGLPEYQQRDDYQTSIVPERITRKVDSFVEAPPPFSYLDSSMAVLSADLSTSVAIQLIATRELPS